MILIDASTRCSHICLLSTCNVAFARLFVQMIILWAQFLNYPIKTIHLDNVGKFTSQTFIDYCMSIGMNIEHPVAHTHTQNGLAKPFIKCLQLIARLLLMKTKLPNFSWRYAIIHVAALVCIQPTTYHEYSSSQLVIRKQPNIFHLQIFGCAIYILITPTQCTKMGPQWKLGIYVSFDSPSIISYLESLIDDIFTARFANCHFNESVFPSLRREKPILEEWL